MKLEDHEYNQRLVAIGTGIYAYATPFIFVIGLLGNIISLKVFTSKLMRRFSSSSYLVCLSASDIVVLFFYVFLDWLNRGLHKWPHGFKFGVIHFQGMCQIFLYTSYVFRFTSVYLMVLLSADRYVVLYCKRYRKKFSKKAFAHKAMVVLLVLAMLLSIYKPVLSGVYPTWTPTGEVPMCQGSPEYEHANNVLDITYAVLITGVPFLLTVTLSLPILVKAVSTRKESRLAFRQNQIRLEFTFIQLGLSACFICFNLPYFVVWCHKYTSVTNTDKLNGLHLITKTFFYLNYSCKFFLYCITGAYYRREIKSIVFFYQSSRPNDNETKPQTQVCNL